MEDLPYFARGNDDVAAALRIASQPRVRYDEGPQPGEATITPREVPLSERVSSFLMGDSRPTLERRRVAESLGSVVDLMPPDPYQAAGDMIKRGREGDYLGFMEAGFGAIPTAGSIKAYHGSPYEFDKFTSRKMGAGAGMQTEGHGLYFTTDPDLAHTYARELSGATAGAKSPHGSPLAKSVEDISEYLSPSDSWAREHALKQLYYNKSFDSIATESPRRLANELKRRTGFSRENDLYTANAQKLRDRISEMENTGWRFSNENGRLHDPDWNKHIPAYSMNALNDLFRKGRNVDEDEWVNHTATLHSAFARSWPEAKQALENRINQAYNAPKQSDIAGKVLERYREAKKLPDETEKLKKEGFTDARHSSGHVYTVDINHNPEEFLDLDKKLSEQPEIFKKLGASEQHLDWSGMDYLRHLESVRGVKKAADELHKKGIPGTTVLDENYHMNLAMPRTESTPEPNKDDHRTYVVFRNKGINILDRKKRADGGAVMEDLPDGFELDSGAAEPPAGFEVQSAPDSFGRQAAAAARGVTRAIPFSQDIGAAIDVGRTYVGGRPEGVPTEGSFDSRYMWAKRRQKEIDESLSNQYPATTLAGQVAGTFALPMAGPASAVAARAAPMVGARAAGALGAGSVGAGYGALYGLSEGDSAGDRLKNAGVGATIGGIGGAAIPSLVSGLGGVGRYAAEKAGFGNSKGIAERQLGAAYQSAPGDRMAMTPAQAAEAAAAGQPVLPIDVGGQAVKGLAKTAAVVSPEARSILATELHQRTQDQAPRLYDFAESLVGKRLDDPDVIKNLRDTARAYNSPAYKAAMDKGSGGVWNDRLGQLINHPWIKKAIPEAIEESNAAAVIDGLPSAKNPFVVDAAGNYKLPVDANGNVTRPTLEFWHTLKQNIQGKISEAEPTHATRGQPNVTRVGNQLKNALVNELYSIVPEYRVATQGAGRYLGEEDAFRFGSKFLKATDAAAVNAGKKALSGFTPEELELAKHSYMAERLQKYLNRPLNQDISKMFSSPVMKDKDVAILGKKAADQMEAFILREGLMHNATSALGGSDTAPKLMAAAKFASAHGLGVIGGAGAGAYEGATEHGATPASVAKSIAAGAALGWMAQRGLNLADKTAVEIAKKLVSNDPQAVQGAINSISANPHALKALRGAYGASLAPLAARKGIEQQREQRASGGRVYPAKPMNKLEKAARRAHLDIAKELEPVMAYDDDVVAQALETARHG